ncbi:MAG TPA: pantoate--beta-alanine ligase [Candidatus Hydrogenedentes bacterium]|nr:pantoate--beta-alanine ligase [Candidatus Hydrogenedentota bacterium]
MIVLESSEAMQAWSDEQRRKGRTIGLVPTMGALHEGHASLMRAAANENDVAIASIFVNPAQFAPHEDFDKYPRTWDADLALCASCGITAIYAPSKDALYPPGYATYISVEGLSEGLCGVTRPIFFRGVATVVAKLFNAVRPHRAYFGQKDAQQCAVVKRMTQDLDFGIEIIVLPTVREADGLAMSSRNRYLNLEERARALCLSRSLFAAQASVKTGERDAATICEAVRAGMSEVRIDYVELVDADTMQPIKRLEKPAVLAVAAFVGEARLIDNIVLNPNQSGD